MSEINEDWKILVGNQIKNETKRTVSCGTGACVEVTVFKDFVRLRSTENVHKELLITLEEWADFVEAVKEGTFD